MGCGDAMDDERVNLHLDELMPVMVFFAVGLVEVSLEIDFVGLRKTERGP